MTFMRLLTGASLQFLRHFHHYTLKVWIAAREAGEAVPGRADLPPCGLAPATGYVPSVPGFQGQSRGSGRVDLPCGFAVRFAPPAFLAQDNRAVQAVPIALSRPLSRPIAPDQGSSSVASAPVKK